ncbi:hypothetical protein EDB85DRAFT_508172 [Lactarius pseudohatsudake]|nr:hypothetical protein EDB85DRAFT_508172 [Lactarius pseudohatsudake]
MTTTTRKPKMGVVESDDDEGSGSSASFVHGALCIVGFLLVLPSGALMARSANVTRSPRAFLLHRLLQFGVGSCVFPFPQFEYGT